jgi:hypothetical protein
MHGEWRYLAATVCVCFADARPFEREWHCIMVAARIVPWIPFPSRHARACACACACVFPAIADTPSALQHAACQFA